MLVQQGGGASEGQAFIRQFAARLVHQLLAAEFDVALIDPNGYSEVLFWFWG